MKRPVGAFRPPFSGLPISGFSVRPCFAGRINFSVLSDAAESAEPFPSNSRGFRGPPGPPAPAAAPPTAAFRSPSPQRINFSVLSDAAEKAEPLPKGWPRQKLEKYGAVSAPGAGRCRLPEGQPQLSPGQRPGNRGYTQFSEPCKGDTAFYGLASFSRPLTEAPRR